MASLNAGGALSGVGSGASLGATIGSVVPGVGTGIGALVGGLGGGIAGLFGKKKKKKTLSRFDKNQQKLNEAQFESLFGGSGPLSDLYNYDPNQANEVFNKTIADPAYRGFQENVIPGITGQFRGNNLMQSSYAGDALSKAGRDVQERLDAERARYLYGEQTNARDAKRRALEDFQNRTTFDWDKTGKRGFSDVLGSMDDKTLQGLLQFAKQLGGV